MIPAGRIAIDINGIAELHGLSIHQANAHRPWKQPGHPAPLTPGRPGRGRPLLWDRDQAAAYAHGKPIPSLPEPGNPNDLLTVTEAAELVGIAVATWTRYESYERTRTRPDNEQPIVPPPDELVCGVPHWHRHTVETYRTKRVAGTRTTRGGRPAGATNQLSHTQTVDRIAELLANAHRDGTEISIAEIARTLGIHYTTAHRLVHRLTDTPPAEG